MSKESRVRDLIAKWTALASGEPEPKRYMTLKDDLYNVRNSVAGKSYPSHLIDPDDEVMASVEHYFLCRAWVGNGVYSSMQMKLMKGAYNAGKRLGVTPKHNAGNPTTPPSAMQTMFQDEGIRDGEADLKASGKSVSLITKPPTYW